MLTNLGRSRLKSRLWHLAQFFLGSLCLILLFSSPNLSGLAQSPAPTQARVSEIVGSQVLIKSQPAKVGNVARAGEQIRTTQARTQLTFDTGAIGRLGQNSALTVGRQCFQIQRGAILVNGAVNGCSSTVRAGVRGTTYYMDINKAGNTHIRVLEGEVEVSQLNKPKPQVVQLRQGQGIIIERDGRLGPVRQMPQESYEEILRGPLVDGFTTELPNLDKVKRAFETVFPGSPFPINSQPGTSQGQGDWNAQLNLSRISDSERDANAIRLQLDILNKPATDYANAVYQLYARKGNEWIQIYSSRGSRLISNQAGAVTLPPEDIPVYKLWFGRLGDRVNLSELELQAVVQLRYDIPGGQRDARLQLETKQFYSQLPVGTQSYEF